jgi:hypothetical protein
VQRVERLLQRICVADERLQIQNASGETLQTGRPRVAVAVDELEIDLYFS